MDYATQTFPNASWPRALRVAGWIVFGIGFFGGGEKALLTGGVVLIVGYLMRIEDAIRQNKAQ
ncbi:hypothetical protein Cme02nite_20880 [Catellatospora methionotrophica]|uniref:Uncharacterized protein n=1 Tax=Catellatospora methionotrophica TaxID=121620 RepID=A0A8J3PDQ4_9ACTN|nr:hypothetical protein [Catellatospora methionotrophica]GIG13756.1 hypothetical protein Cme02nite_20880 [Catellatospora methionotrophica]